MSEEFKPIETQEQLNAVIGDRIKRAQDSVRREYADYADLKRASETWADAEADYKDKLQKANDTIRRYETDSLKRKIAEEVGLPVALASRITGDDEAAMRTDAEALKAIIPGRKAPARNEEAPLAGSSYQKLLNGLKR